MKYLITYWLLLSGALTVVSQTNITWQDLAKVKITEEFLAEEGMTYDVPTFSSELQQLHEQEVLISGYLIPLNKKDQLFVLSKNPYASCFFCGGAGPESVMELWLKPESFRRFKLDERVQFKGTLLLNKDNFDHCMYILRDAVEIL